MKTSRFTEKQILGILKQTESGLSVPLLCRQHGMSDAYFYKWRNKYGGMDASMIALKKALARRYRINPAHPYDTVIRRSSNY